MDLNRHRVEIEQFLFDLRDHLKHSMEPTNYENTMNLFSDSSEFQNIKLLERCEKILSHFSDSSNNNNHKVVQNGFSTPEKPSTYNKSAGSSMVEHIESEDISYLEMSSTPPKKAISTEYIDFQEQKIIENPIKSHHPDNEEDDDDDDNEENRILDKGIYDLCNESIQSEDGLKENLETESNSIIQDCPYAGLPASHLSIQKSTKFGQLQRIERRLFFDQCKKCYCGIISDWLLCYCDGITSLRPTFSLHLKTHGVEVEHHGDGKRRELCFQITTPDPNKKHVFLCNSEVEAKEWIHAIEAVIRGDSAAHSSAVASKSPRKLPTPPISKKSFPDNKSNRSDSNNDCIYEEPSPLYNMHQPTELLIERSKDDDSAVPNIPEKQKSMTSMAKKFDYDIPKSPPQPVNSESETAELLDISRNHSDFQAKVKDVHSKLSSQLSTSGPSPDRLRKIVKKTLSSDSESSVISPQLTPTTKEQKKAVKSSQKHSKSPNQEKSSRNWFLNRLNKTTSSTRSSTASPTKCKQSEKENLLNNLEISDGYEGDFISPSSNIPTADIKASKVNMIINQFEASGHLTMYNVEAFNGGLPETTKLSSFCESDCNNYEPIMTGPSSFMKKV
ncbi:uncharacterized protein LOC129952688 [Eupeodes corollae]|uniref:uncharacterized protein LOC129952688 n=1 Tax=Eupeodes corollae TaxID=290404 RepID=UPI00249284DB|nr:uncharacterized protein LOC129952688 [Eupeodes corollae]XP_055921424.1 uncharacterized protein LOC129952688 [Eupeodes corollae]XP_055921425.1 uncharacterized protein LOC129952688 [Eupeodes corollae]